MSTSTSIIRNTLLVVSGAAIALPVAGAAFPAGDPFVVGLPPAATGFAERTAASASGFGQAVAADALELTGTTAQQAGSLAGQTARDAGETVTSTTEPVIEETTHTAEQAVETATAVATDTTRTARRTAVDTVARALTGKVEACPGVPVSTGVRLQPRDVLLVRTPLRLRSPQAITTAAVETARSVEVGLPDTRSLTSDPLEVQLQPGGTTGASVEAPVVDRALSQTKAGAQAPEPDRLTGAARSDVDTAQALLPTLTVTVGQTESEVTSSAWVSSPVSGGGLSFRLSGPAGAGCTTVTWSIAG